MLNVRQITIASFAALLMSSGASFAQGGRQCVPAVANPAAYSNCRISVTPNGEICRCAIGPAAVQDAPRGTLSNLPAAGVVGQPPAGPGPGIVVDGNPIVPGTEQPPGGPVAAVGPNNNGFGNGPESGVAPGSSGTNDSSTAGGKQDNSAPR